MRSFLLLGFFACLIAGQANSLVDCGQVCELDATGRSLTFPGPVVTKTVVATTSSIITYQDAQGSIIVQTSTETADLHPLTWEVSGVALTYPTTYVLYTDFVHSFVATKTAGGSLACSTGSASLELGTSTDFASLIFPASEVVSALPPSPLVGYLESIPTVFAQLGGSVNSSCDPVAAVTSPTINPGPTATLTATNTLTTAVTVSTSVTVTDQFASVSASTLVIPVSATPPFGNGTASARPPPTISTITTSTTESPTSSSSSTPLSISSSSSLSSSSETSSTTTTTTGTTSSSTVTATATLTSFSTPSGASLTTVTFTGAISSLESAPPGNLTATATSPSTSIQLANFGNQFADAAYVGTGGWLASILGLAIYWL